MVEIKELLDKDIGLDLLRILKDAFKHDSITVGLAKQRMRRRRNRGVYTFGIFLDNQLIGTASVLLELKLFKQERPFVAHIEDVAIHKDYRGFGYGKQLVEHLVDFARRKDCYKVVLFCSNDNTVFYKKCGFRHTSNLMRRDLD